MSKQRDIMLYKIYMGISDPSDSLMFYQEFQDEIERGEEILNKEIDTQV